MEYEFTLKYQLQEDDDVDLLLERLAEAGCDDAVVGVGQPARLALAFVRESQSARQAIESALHDVRAAIPSARLIEATPDLVGLTDIAHVIGVSRQNMRKLMLSHMHSFPAPIHEGSTSLWHLVEVLAWLQARGSYAIGQEVIDLAAVARSVNVAHAYERVFGPATQAALR
ncbi:DNA-binding protein [Serratia sp. Se-PFBMAAmG]|nr:DNA-binding protein [Serratia sp. Se-PFBMAAmG]